jgi:hypothetical protein
VFSLKLELLSAEKNQMKKLYRGSCIDVPATFGSIKNVRTPEQNISLRNLCKNFWLEETAILDMQMSKLPMISG